MIDQERCKENVLSEFTRDFILNTNRQSFLDAALEEAAGEDRQYLGGTYYSLSVSETAAGGTLSQFPYDSVPKCYTLLDTGAMEEAGILRIQNYPGLELQGEGVLVGIVDTGVDYTLETFRDLAGNTRIAAIWDQTIQEGTPPEQFCYGTVYPREEINAALRAETPAEIVPSTDTDGHGTFLASLLCGGADETGAFIGAAPMAELAVVKLKPAKQYLRAYYYVREGAACYQETDVMAGIRYLDELAKQEGKPLALCLALGTNTGSHTGASPLGTYLDLLANTARHVVAVGTGNEAEKRHHFYGILPEEGDETDVEIRVGAQSKGFLLESWSDIPNIFELSISSPSGQIVERISIRESMSAYQFVFEQTKVYVSAKVLVEGTNAGVFVLRFDRPAEGIWTIGIRCVRAGSGIFHMWLPVTEFLDSDIYFLRPDPDCTITEPANAQDIMTVAAYNAVDNAIAISSGRGYTREERIKPDFAAPGVMVRGYNTRGQLVQRSGTSISAAIAAGAGALLLEWLVVRSGQNVNSVQVKNLLILGTKRRTDLTWPNREWGYGAVNLYQTFEEFRRY